MVVVMLAFLIDKAGLNVSSENPCTTHRSSGSLPVVQQVDVILFYGTRLTVVVLNFLQVRRPQGESQLGSDKCPQAGCTYRLTGEFRMTQ